MAIVNENKAKHPTWWAENHTSGWDRMKAAIKRDWEQTKADFGAKKAHDLNQDMSDTLKQATGKVPIPPGDTPNAPDTSDVKRHLKAAEKAEQHAAKVQERANDALMSENVSPDQAIKQQGKVVDARLDAAKAQNVLERDMSVAWEDVEDPVRYGYGAGLYYSSDWSEDIEPNLRSEWEEFDQQRSWNDVREYVRLGWDRARTPGSDLS